MNDIPTHVTGGELNSLWRVANIHLPKIQNAYNDPLTEVHKVDGTADDQKYGRCHPWWVAIACELERAMFSTVGSLAAASSALNRAVDAYTRVDGNSGKALTPLGEDLADIIDSEGSEKVDWETPDDYHGPNFSLPDSWSDVHNGEDDGDE